MQVRRFGGAEKMLDRNGLHRAQLLNPCLVRAKFFGLQMKHVLLNLTGLE
ncbi:hypothetical protein M3G15_07285 [Paenibacillus sp. p3-SID1389]|nr:hypothetical protein [Paenibacillus sp. p3-SID1389]MCT2194938.1 hypothetical protein [Paenibacillus sp. p3-SID1389]